MHIYVHILSIAVAVESDFKKVLMMNWRPIYVCIPCLRPMFCVYISLRFHTPEIEYILCIQLTEICHQRNNTKYKHRQNVCHKRNNTQNKHRKSVCHKRNNTKYKHKQQV